MKSETVQVYCIFFFWLLFIRSGHLPAQQATRIKGIVSDASTGKSLPYVNVSLLPAQLGIGTITDEDGKYSLELVIPAKDIMFSYVGYRSVTVSVKSLKNNTINIRLEPETTSLEDVVISGKRIRYRNKGNPAVDLIRKVIENKDKNRIESRSTYEYDQYEKVKLSLNDLNDSITDSRLFRTFPFLSGYIDTIHHTRQLLLPVFIREKIFKKYYQKSPGEGKEYLIATRMANFHDLIEQETISTFMDGMVGSSNIYDNKIMILDNEYLSPLSPLSPGFYRFHILDTVNIGDIPCIQLSVYPRNSQDFGLRGNLFVTNDSMYALKRIELAFTKNNPVNFVNDFSLVQEYTLLDSVWCLTSDRAVIDFSLVKRKSMLLGERTNTYYNYRFDQEIPKGVFSGINKLEKSSGYDTQTQQYWQENRPVPLARSEQGVYDMIAEMKSDKWFKQILNLSGIAFSGYLEAGRFDIGPVESLLSFNDIEGARVRLGGKTNARFNPHWFFEGYLAYGFNDEKLKYQVSTMYSFNENKIHPWEFPMNLITISYESNIETPGQSFVFGNADRLILSFHRGNAQQMVYHRTFNLKYDLEYTGNFSIQPSFTHRIEQPAGNLSFSDAFGEIDDITTSQLGMKLRFAPNERFYQIQRNRYTLNHTNPVFVVQYLWGIKDFLGGDYNFHRVEISIDKRSWFSSLGFADVWFKAGKIWNQVPFPLLVIHQANQNYIYQDRAFNMMNYMEFVSDQYASVNISYCFNGWIFNRIPLLKKLKLREFITFKSLWGNISEKNNPANDPYLFRFPENEDGQLSMYGLNGKPYMEAGIGIDNLFKFFRVDLIRRINYLDHPDIPEWGVRFGVRFVF